MIKILRLLLFPFAILYGIVIWVRNKLYDYKVLKSTQFDLPIICIGNLVVGGAGKTPVTEYIVRLLMGHKVAILSRGYGRKTKGFLLADAFSTAATIGDEPLQYFKKFKNITVAVCEDRVAGIKKLESTHDVILLDDAFQHRAVKPGYSLLLFEYEKLKSLQFLLPMGNLREHFSNYRRATAVLITKAPLPLNMVDQIEVRKKVDTRIDQRISFSKIKYGELVHVINGSILPNFIQKNLFVLTGIANPKPLLTYLGENGNVIKHFEHPDHYQFKETDVKHLIEAFNNDPSTEKLIITTEKDCQRLLGENIKDLLLNLPVYYLPIEIELAPKDKFTFDQNILEYVANHKRIS